MTACKRTVTAVRRSLKHLQFNSFTIMAKIIYEIRQNENAKMTGSYGKYYAYSKSIETINTRGMANHIAGHGSIYTTDVVFGMLEKFRSCLIEMLLDSKRVKIDGLGTFFTTIENSIGSNKKKDYSVQKNVKALHIRFLPEQEQEMNISSREFLKKAQFINIETLLKGAENSENSSDNGSEGDNNGGNNGGSGSDPIEDRP